MSRKIEKRKTAVFCLEPDGFSIHTFELFLKLSKSDYDKLKDKLYREYPGTYQTKHDVEDQEDKKKNESKYIVHNCKCEKFAKHGVSYSSNSMPLLLQRRFLLYGIRVLSQDGHQPSKTDRASR